jgi:hypothetical protein
LNMKSLRSHRRLPDRESASAQDGLDTPESRPCNTKNMQIPAQAGKLLKSYADRVVLPKPKQKIVVAVVSVPLVLGGAMPELTPPPQDCAATLLSLSPENQTLLNGPRGRGGPAVPLSE